MYNVLFLDRVEDDIKSIVLRDTFFPGCSDFEHIIPVSAYTRNYFKNRLRSASRTGKQIPVVVEIFDNTIKIVWILQCFDRTDNYKFQIFNLAQLFDDEASDAPSGNLIYPTN